MEHVSERLKVKCMDGDGTPKAADAHERQGLLECFQRKRPRAEEAEEDVQNVIWDLIDRRVFKR